jgi:hypothetical protein
MARFLTRDISANLFYDRACTAVPCALPEFNTRYLTDVTAALHSSNFFPIPGTIAYVSELTTHLVSFEITTHVPNPPNTLVVDIADNTPKTIPGWLYAAIEAGRI